METIFSFIKSLNGFTKALTNLFGGDDGGLLHIVIKNFPKAYDQCMGLTYGGKNIVETLQDIIMPIAFCFLLLYFLIDLLSQTASVSFTTETFIRSFGKFIVGFIIVSNAYVFSDYIVEFSNKLIYEGNVEKTITSSEYGVIADAVTTSAIFGSNKTTALLQYLQSPEAKGVLSFNQIVNLLIKTTFQLFVFATASILSIWMAYRRAFYLLVYITFLPLTITDVYGNNMSTSAMRHIKKIFSLAMQYPLVYIICAIGLELIEITPTASTNWIAYIGQLFVVTLAIWKSIKNSASEIDNMFG